MLKSGILRIKVFYLIPAFFLLSSTAKTIGQNIVYLEIQNDFLNYKGHGTDKYFTGGNFWWQYHCTKKEDEFEFTYQRKLFIFAV